MAQFSIRQALEFSLSAYKKHWLVLLASGAMLGCSVLLLHVGPGIAIEKIGINQEELKINQSTAQPVIGKLNEFTQKISMHLESTPKKDLILLFFFIFACWMLHLFFVLGLFRVVLHIKDNDTADLNLFFQDKQLIFPGMGLAIIIFLYALSMLGGIALLSVPTIIIIKHLLGSVMLKLMMGMTSLIVIGLAFSFWVVGYIFALLVLVDKPKLGVRAAITMSQSLVSGTRLKIMGTIIIVGCIYMLLALFVSNILTMIGLCKMYMQQAIITTFLMPLMYLVMVYVYRALSEK